MIVLTSLLKIIKICLVPPLGKLKVHSIKIIITEIAKIHVLIGYNYWTVRIIFKIKVVLKNPFLLINRKRKTLKNSTFHISKRTRTKIFNSFLINGKLRSIQIIHSLRNKIISLLEEEQVLISKFREMPNSALPNTKFNQAEETWTMNLTNLLKKKIPNFIPKNQ